MKYLLIALLVLSTPVFAQSVSVPKEIVDAGVSQCVITIDLDQSKIAVLQSQAQSITDNITAEKENIDNENAQLTAINDKITALSSDIDTNKQSLTYLASQQPAVQSALDLLNAHPEYGVDWQVQP